jgi:hypothetical protein
MMDRRNFIGSLLGIGAGFTVLPSIPGGRIWRAETKVIGRPDEVQSIWQTHCLSWYPRAGKPKDLSAAFGDVRKTGAGLWFRTVSDWMPLERMEEPLRGKCTAQFGPGFIITREEADQFDISKQPDGLAGDPWKHQPIPLIDVERPQYEPVPAIGQHKEPMFGIVATSGNLTSFQGRFKSKSEREADHLFQI